MSVGNVIQHWEFATQNLQGMYHHDRVFLERNAKQNFKGRDQNPFMPAKPNVSSLVNGNSKYFNIVWYFKLPFQHD